MNSISVLDPDFVSAFEEVVDVLRSVAQYEFDDDLQDRMRELGENKDRCSPEEREGHRQLAEFWRSQTLRKLRALNVLKRLHRILLAVFVSSGSVIFAIDSDTVE
jgi:hypothetical protein